MKCSTVWQVSIWARVRTNREQYDTYPLWHVLKHLYNRTQVNRHTIQHSACRTEFVQYDTSPYSQVSKRIFYNGARFTEISVECATCSRRFCTEWFVSREIVCSITRVTERFVQCQTCHIKVGTVWPVSKKFRTGWHMSKPLSYWLTCVKGSLVQCDSRQRTFHAV